MKKLRAASGLELSITAALLSAACASSAWGQVPSPGSDRPQQLQREQRLKELNDFNLDRRIKADEMIPIGQRALVDYGIQIELDYLTVKEGNGENRGERIYEAVGYARVNVDGVHEAFVRGRYTYFDYFSENDSFDGRGSRENDDKLDRAYYRFDLGRYMQAYKGKSTDSGLALQGGRDLVYWSNGLVLGQRLDGVIVDAYTGPLTVQAIAGVTPQYTVDFDSSRPDYDTNTRRGFYGAMFTYDAGQHRPFFYYLRQQDYNDDNDGVDIGGIETKFKYNSQYWGVGSNGNFSDRLLYGIEAAYETGKTYSTSFRTDQPLNFIAQEQSNDDIQAFAINGRLEYLVPDDRHTRFSIEETVATGDGDRGNSSDTYNGNHKGTDDHAFNGFGLINSGLAFAPNLANLSITRFGVATNPFPNFSPTRRLQIGTDVLTYFKLMEHGNIDEGTTDDGRFLGVEADFYVNYQITSDLTFVFRYGIFFPTDNLFVDDNDRQFLFLGATYAF